MKSYRLVFTDSGLGGLSVMGVFLSRLEKRVVHGTEFHIECTFINALPGRDQGYNRMPADLRVKTFNHVLETIFRTHGPDLVAVACNTLSAILPLTGISPQHRNRTMEIIAMGRAMIDAYLQDQNEQNIIVLATPATIESGVYHFSSERISHLSGGNLASLIESHWASDILKRKISELYKRAKKINPYRKLTLFFGCTHYGYVASLFHELASLDDTPLTILNPNDTFASRIHGQFVRLTGLSEQTVIPGKLSVSIISKAEITKEERSVFSRLLSPTSEILADALKDYMHMPGLF